MSEENEEGHILSKRYTRLAIFSAFALAFLWPLGGYVFWLCLGPIAYFTFLSYYYSPRSKQFINPRSKQSARFDKESSSARTNQQRVEPLGVNQIKKVRIAILAISGAIIFIAIVIALLNPDEGEAPVNEDPTYDVSVDRTALQKDPNDVNALTNIGNQFYGIQQYDSAMFYYERVLTFDPRNTACLHNKALVLYQKKDYPQSLEWAKKCLSTDPEYTDAILLIGDGYYIQENYSEAIVWYKQAYAKGARHTDLLNVMAFIYDKQNNRGEATRLYKETLQQDSSYAEAYERLAELDPARSDWYRIKAEQWKTR